MCGIAGIVYLKPVAESRPVNDEKVLALLYHRGPDSQTVKRLGNDTVFYHTRLEIIDTTHASDQPFMDDSGDALVFNGEIFNYKELQLQHDGLKTTGDVEVLFRSLQRDG